MSSSSCAAVLPSRSSDPPSGSGSSGPPSRRGHRDEPGSAVPTVLLVEDEDSLRNTLARFLAREGYRVIAAANAHEAFDRGLRASPDFLVADWMLRSGIHGLQVSDVLRGVSPSLRTILITGFPSRDLQSESERRGVAKLLEKPFDLEALQDALERASERPARERERPVAVIEVEEDGAIAFASVGARALLAATGAGSDAGRMQDLLGRDLERVLEEAQERWVETEPRGGSAPWLIRSYRLDDGGWRIVVCLADEEHLTRDPRVRLLLHDRVPLETVGDPRPVILVEPDPVLRRLLVSQIERFGSICYPADDLVSVLRLLEAEPRVRHVFVDFEGISADATAWIEALRSHFLEVSVVAVGSVDARGARVLAKPWRIHDLQAILDGS